MNEQDPDLELLRRVGENDPQAVAQLVARKLPRLLALAGRLLGDTDEAQDVAQESFLKIWKHAAGWRPGAARFDTWLHRVALNLCYDRLRRRREQPLADEHLALADPRATPDQAASDDDRRRAVQRALATLPQRQREALVLQYYQGLGNREAAELMGIHVEALESLLARARRNLRAALAGVEGASESRGRLP